MTKVLIVDDKPNNLMALENVLKRLDVEIVKASTGNEALRATLNHDFALAILDVQMPLMDGFELANLLRSDHRTRDIPIIFLSAVHSEEQYVFKGYEAGAVDYITKPFNPDVLLSKVRVFLELNMRKAELVRAHDQLEERVRERTAELTAAHELLRTQADELERQNKRLLSAFIELSKTQEALSESEERYRVMGDTIPYGVWMCDAKGRAEYISPSFLDLLDMSLEQARASGWSGRLVDADSRPLPADLLECVCGGKPVEAEQKIVDRNGVEHTVLARGLPVRGENGEIKKWVGIHLDITERKRMEETILLDEARLEALFEISQMLELSRKEIADYAVERMVSLTNSKLAWLDFPKDEKTADANAWSKCAIEEAERGSCEWPAGFDAESEAICARAIREKRVVIINDYAALDPGAKCFPEGLPGLTRLLCVPVFDRGRIVAVGAVGNKATDYDHSDIRQMSLLLEGVWKHVERQRADRDKTQYMQRLELLNQELQDFAYIASHDLQEPLRKIQAFGDRLRSRCAAKLDETETDYLVRMEGAANRMQDLIRDLLKFSRIATKSDPFEKVDLNEVLREVVQIFDFRVQRMGGKINVSRLPVIDADPTQMKQLFQNLIGNSLKFQKEGKAPVITVRGECDSANSCLISIEDNGIGFDERHSARIFAPFQRLHTRAEYEGTGMGLAICRKIVERHGGEISAKSRPGSGSTFMVSLPVKHD